MQMLVCLVLASIAMVMPTDGYRSHFDLINQLTRTIVSPAAPMKPPTREPVPAFQPPNRSTNWAPAPAFPPPNKPKPWEPAPVYPRQNKPTHWAPAPSLPPLNIPAPRAPARVLPPRNRPIQWLPAPVYPPRNEPTHWAPAPAFPPPLKPLPMEPEETPPPPAPTPAAVAAICLANYSSLGDETLSKLNVELSKLRNQAMTQIELIPVVDVLEDVLPLIEDFLIELEDAIIKFREILPASVTPELNTVKLSPHFRRLLGNGVKHHPTIQYNWI